MCPAAAALCKGLLRQQLMPPPRRPKPLCALPAAAATPPDRRPASGEAARTRQREPSGRRRPKATARRPAARLAAAGATGTVAAQRAFRRAAAGPPARPGERHSAAGPDASARPPPSPPPPTLAPPPPSRPPHAAAASVRPHAGTLPPSALHKRCGALPTSNTPRLGVSAWLAGGRPAPPPQACPRRRHNQPWFVAPMGRRPVDRRLRLAAAARLERQPQRRRPAARAPCLPVTAACSRAWRWGSHPCSSGSSAPRPPGCLRCRPGRTSARPHATRPQPK